MNGGIFLGDGCGLGDVASRLEPANQNAGITMAYKLDVPTDAEARIHCPVCEKHDGVIHLDRSEPPLTVVIGGYEIRVRTTDLGGEWEKPYSPVKFFCRACYVWFCGYLFFNDPEQPPVMIVTSQEEDIEHLVALIDDAQHHSIAGECT